MTIRDQIRGAVRLQIEDFRRGINKFFRVPFKTVILMLIIVIALIFHAYLRLVTTTGEVWRWDQVLVVLVIALSYFSRRFLP